jgi:hypothetical protein
MQFTKSPIVIMAIAVLLNIATAAPVIVSDHTKEARQNCFYDMDARICVKISPLLKSNLL